MLIIDLIILRLNIGGNEEGGSNNKVKRWHLAKTLKHDLLVQKQIYWFIVPTHFSGGGTIYSTGVFCSVNFCRSIISSYRIVGDIIIKLVNFKLTKFLNFSFSEELRRFKDLKFSFAVLSDHQIKGTVVTSSISHYWRSNKVPVMYSKFLLNRFWPFRLRHPFLAKMK